MKRHLLLVVLLTTSFLYAQRDSGTPVKGVGVISKTAVSSGNTGKAVQPSYKVGATTGASTESSEEVGLTEGQLSVSPTGGATYTVPIALPPGIKGVVPSVGLTYNSQSGNGLAGYGWNLGGLSAISRVPSTIFHDGRTDAVDFDGLDRFALDGQRLLLKSGSYGSNGTIYQTERYSNLKITSHGSSPYSGIYGPAYFKVAWPDGSVAFYGLTSDSRSQTTYALSYRESPQGIRIHYHYTTSGNTLYIDKIIYGGTDNTPAINEISFTYKNRQRSETAYIGGLAFTNDKLLSAIRVKGSGKSYRTYLLSHELTSLGYQRLTGITEESGDGSKQYNPTVFTYEDTPKAISDTQLETTLSVQDINAINTEVVSGDFTGDGRMDVIIHPSGHTQSNPKDKYWLFTDLKNGQATEIGWRHDVGTFDHIFPVNWLNHSEKLMPIQGWVVAKAIQSGYELTTYSAGGTSPIYQQQQRSFSWPEPTTIPAGHSSYGSQGQLVSGDFNGDGITDVLALKTKNVFKKCIRLGCTEYITPTTPSREMLFINMDPRLSSGYTTAAGKLLVAVDDDTRIRVADVTGDGKANLLVFTPGKVMVYGLNWSGKMVFLWQTTDTHIAIKRPLLLGDYNGDGKTDIIIPKDYGHNYMHYRATGKGFSKTDVHYSVEYKENKDSPPGLFSSSKYFVQQLLPIDMNHDGKTDLVALESRKHGGEPMRYIVKVYENYNVFLLGATRTLNGGKKYPLPLVLRSDRPNDHLEVGMMSDRTIFHFQYLKDMSREKLLRTITNGYGVQEHIYYSSLTQKALYQDDMPVYQTALYTEQYPNTDMGIVPGFYVVSKLERAGVRQLFGYYGGVSNVEGLGFLGFRAIAKTNWHNQDIPAMTTLSRQDPSLRGAVTEAYTLAGLPWGLQQTPQDFISKTDYFYEAELTPDKVFGLKNTLRETVNPLEGTHARVSTTFDDYHNSTQTTATVSHNGGAQHTTTTEFTYAHNTEGTPYYIGRLMEKSRRVTGYGTTMTSSETYQYNGQQLPSQIEKTGHQTEALTETLSYDTFGNVTARTLSVEGLAPRTTRYTYDNSGRFIVEQTGPEGLQTQYSYDQSSGWLLSETDPYDRQTTYGYDVWGKQTRVTDYLGKQTTYSYSRSREGYRIAQIGEDDSFRIAIYDKLHGHLVETGVRNLTNIVRQQFDYDALGRKVRESEPYYGSAPTQWTTMAYDAYGRVKQTTAYTGKVTTISYNGLTTTVSDGTQTTVTTKDAIGNVIRHTDNGGTVDYTYFANGNLKQADYDGVVIELQQDGWGRKTRLTDPSAGTYSYQYNGFGQLTEETTPKGTTKYTYNDTGRLTQKALSGDATDMTLEYSYAPESQQLTAIHALSNGNSFVYEYGYDSYQRPIRTVEQSPYAQFERQWQYDSFGRLTKEGYTAADHTSGKSMTGWIQHHYKNGQAWKITDDTTGELLWQTEAVNPRGQLTKGHYGNGIAVTKQYDSYGLPLLYSHDTPTGDGTANLMLLEYAFNVQRGTLTSRSSSLFQMQEEFTYDNLDRLTGFSDHTGSYEQGYDKRGRITQHPNIGEYRYSDTHPYRATQVELTPQGYEHYNERGAQRLSYNAFKKPISIHVEGKERIDFQYNPFKGRSAMFYGSDAEDITERPLQKYYSADGRMEIKATSPSLGEGSGVGFLYYIGGDAYTAPVVVKSDGDTSEFLYLHRDYLGSIVAITDQEGELLEKRHFDAWGNIVHLQHENNSSLPLGGIEGGPGLILDRGYTGHEHLEGVGLIHMNGRLYDPLLHRFLAPDNYVQDPFNTQNFNRYGYVLNNPLMYTDPSGEFWHIVIGAVVGGVVNLAVKAAQGKINSWKDGFTAFGIGAVAGVVGAATGGMAFAAAGGAAGGAGGFIAGATAGAVGTAFAAPIQSMGNTAYFGDPMMTWKQYLMGVGIGALTGGIINGGIAAANGRNFWNGNFTPQTSPLNIQAQGLKDITPYEKGQEGLRLNNIQQNNTRIDSYTNTARYRVPDEMIKVDKVITQIGEVKHYSLGRTVSFTKQLEDFILYSNQNQIPFQLYVPRGVGISVPLQNAINQSHAATIIWY